MQVIELSIGWTILIDVLAWAFFHICISLGVWKIPAHYFSQDYFILRVQSWEDNGEIWGKLFRIKLWKHFILDGNIVIRQGFEKRKLASRDKEYLQRFLMESRRAEVTHWISMLPAPLFFLWNPIWAGWVMIAYALLFNGPIIIVQRYNRPRLHNIVKRKALILNKE